MADPKSSAAPAKTPQAAEPASWRLVPTQALTDLMHLIDPPPIVIDDKTQRVFRNPNAAFVLTRISAIVRAMVEASQGARAPSAAPAEPAQIDPNRVDWAYCFGGASLSARAPAAEPARDEAMERALRELVACDDLRRAHSNKPLHDGPDDPLMMQAHKERRRREPAAWDAARAALSQAQPEPVVKRDLTTQPEPKGEAK